MTLRWKLAWNTTGVVTAILGLTFLGIFLLFKQHVIQSFYQQLQSTAYTAAFFHLEKDELNSQNYRLVEQRYRDIRHQSIRFFDRKNNMVFEHDTLTYHIPQSMIEQVRKNREIYFEKTGRQFAGIFYEDNEGDYVVFVSGVNQTGLNQLNQLKIYLGVFLLLGIGLSFFLTHLLAKQTFKPFSTLIKEVNAISTENLHARLELTTREKDELSGITLAFNSFLERLEEGVNSQRNFLKHASHELKTPLATLISNLEIALSKPREKEAYQHSMEAVLTDAYHLKSILESLLVLSGLEANQRVLLTEIRLDELLWDLLEKLNQRLPASTLQINLDDVEDKPQLLEINANRDLLLMAIGNVLDNALKYSHHLPVIISLQEEQQALKVTIRDRGAGIAQQEMDLIFQLFYRSPKSHAIPGHGIGLYLSKQIFDLHGIQIQVQSVEGKGTDFILLFPAHLPV